MRRTLSAFAAFSLLLATFSLSASAQDQTKTWTGWVSESSCGVKGMKAKHKDCALKCVKEKDAKWVFVDSGTKDVLKIENQDAVDPDTALGQEVKATGHVTEDGSIHIDSIEPSASAK
jgi:hypothetical protein